MDQKIKELAGSKLMLGVPGTLTDGEVADLFEETHAAGLIIFRRNFVGAQKFKLFLQNLESRLGRRLIVAVDHEGGRVIHLNEGVTFFPDNLTLGQSGREDWAERQGQIEAAELRRLGIDLNLAPTLDVLTAAYSPNIGIRSYGADPALVARLGSARIRGMRSRGLAACAKHFPGQGQSSLDAHLDLPVLETTLEEFEAIHKIPFVAAIEAGVDAIMTSHPVYPRLEDGVRQPATFSRRLVHEFLREDLGFQGLILSDDLEMGALKNFGTVGEAAVRAAGAGHDLILICSDVNAAREAAQHLQTAIREKKLPVEELEAGAERLKRFIQARPERFSSSEAFAEPEGAVLAAKIAGEGIAKAAAGSMQGTELHFEKGDVPTVIYPDLAPLAERIAMEADMLDLRSWLSRELQRLGVREADLRRVSLDPDAGEIENLTKALPNTRKIIYLCFDPHLYPGSKQLLNRIESAGEAAVIFLRDPYGPGCLSRATPYVRAFGFRKAQMAAAFRVLFRKTVTV